MAMFLITAPSGAGKTTIVKSLQSRGVWEECISHTTRAMRKGEKNGETYYFVDHKEYKSMLDNNELAEHVKYSDNYYGISKKEIQRVMKTEKHVVIIVEFEGYKQLKSLYPDAIGIFIDMRKEDCMINMLTRGDSFENAQKRISSYDKEIENRFHYDHIVRSARGEKVKTIKEINNIVSQYRDFSI